MASKDVQDYLEKGMYGSPQIKPDEKKRYLGTFRERVYLTMTIEEMKDKKNVEHFKKELESNPKQQLLLNAAADFSLQNTYMVVAQKANCPFKIVDTEEKADNQTIGLVYAGETAVDIDPISVSEKYRPVRETPSTEVETETTQSEKKGLLSRLFK